MGHKVTDGLLCGGHKRVNGPFRFARVKPLRAQGFGMLAVAALLCASAVLPGAAQAQSSAETTPIGKVVTATGSVSIEHANAVVVQANIPPSGVGQAKTGDLVYKGDVVQT